MLDRFRLLPHRCIRLLLAGLIGYRYVQETRQCRRYFLAEGIDRTTRVE